MNYKSFIIRYKWWIIFGTINTILLSIIYNHFNFSTIFDWRLYLLFLSGSIIGAIASKYRNDELVIFPEFWISFYEGFIFFITYSLIIKIIINHSIIYNQSSFNYALITIPALITIFIFIPINILCGFIGRVLKECKDSKTKC